MSNQDIWVVAFGRLLSRHSVKSVCVTVGALSGGPCHPIFCEREQNIMYKVNCPGQGGKGVEMTQTLYAHMNKRKKKRKKTK
jgi:hypothetical protein